MKQKVITLICVFVYLFCYFIPSGKCQTIKTKPEKVYSIIYVQKSNEWYQQQAALWKIEIEKNPTNPEAWHNYYNANRYAHFGTNSDFSDEKQSRLEKIIKDMGKHIPNTFEYNFLKYKTDHSKTNFYLIEKAYQLAPERPATYYDFISHYDMLGDKEKVKEFCTKLYHSADIAPGLVNYNYNVLISTSENAILFTNGDNDSYPAWMLQNTCGIRTDVTILNVHMIKGDQIYLERKLKEKGIKLDFKELPDLKHETFIAKFCQTISDKYSNIPIYFALTVHQNYINSFQDHLYVVGLAYMYNQNRMDNLALLRKNLEKNFRLDYLKYNWYDEKYPIKESLARLNMNYIVPMIMLAEHYKTSEMNEKANDWKVLALELAQKANKQEEVGKYIKSKGL